jgi:CheY-like chemotaxis protein
MSKAGHVVRGALNGRDALMALADAVPDVVILDVRMPEMDGMQFLDVIRSYVGWSKVPVILLTGYDHTPEMVERAFALGVKTIYLKASYRLEDLAECVRRLATDPNAQCERTG